MSRHLILIALGPVQEFIAQARRTRDLWYGSHLLSELGRAAARALVECKAKLVFPALAADDAELVECQAPLRPAISPSPGGSPPLSIANKILAEVDLSPGEDPEAVVRRVREQVWACWRRIAEHTWKACDEKRVLAVDIRDTWDEQIETFPEFVAAWTPLETGALAYRDARTRLEAAVAGRKNLREFAPWAHQRRGAPKSSLDGARSSVLREFAGAEERPFRIGRGETLDAVGLVKRAGGDPEQFVPVGNVALAAWIGRAIIKVPEAVAKLRHECGQSRIGRVNRPNIKWTASFPFDAQVFLRNRWETLLEEVGRPGEGRAWGERHVAPILAGAGDDPYPYVACLVADGDRMGATLESLNSPDEHRTFSAKLSQFASEARKIVEGDHRGALVYAGGDDVLAFLCLTDALACAKALSDRFDALVREALRSVGGSSPTPSLSVGIGVGHLLESMGELLQLGRDAEKVAKGSWLKPQGRDRNALAIVVDKRSGERHEWRARWSDWGGDPTARLRKDAELLEARLSAKKVYEVRGALRQSPERGVPPAEAGPWRRTLSLEVQRILGRTYASEGVTPEEVGLSLATSFDYDSLYRIVSEWVDRMLVARALAKAGLESTASSLASPVANKESASV